MQVTDLRLERITLAPNVLSLRAVVLCVVTLLNLANRMFFADLHDNHELRERVDDANLALDAGQLAQKVLAFAEPIVSTAFGLFKERSTNWHQASRHAVAHQWHSTRIKVVTEILSGKAEQQTKILSRDKVNLTLQSTTRFSLPTLFIVSIRFSIRPVKL